MFDIVLLFFSLGNIHGSNQPPGVIREPYFAYLQQPLWEGIPLSFEVSRPSGPMRYDGKHDKARIK